MHEVVNGFAQRLSQQGVIGPRWVIKADIVFGESDGR